MTGNNRESDPVGRLVDMLVDDILETSDAELLEEARGRGEDPKAIAERVRALIGNAEAVRGRQRLLDARSAVNADNLRRLTPIGVDAAAARRKLNSIMQRMPGGQAQLTLAARKGNGMSDADVLSMLEDLRELGVTDEDED